jgi:hypothetical protein
MEWEGRSDYLASEMTRFNTPRICLVDYVKSMMCGCMGPVPNLDELKIWIAVLWEMLSACGLKSVIGRTSFMARKDPIWELTDTKFIILI